MLFHRCREPEGLGISSGGSAFLGFAPEVLVVLTALLPLAPQGDCSGHRGQSDDAAQEPAAALLGLLACHVPLRAVTDDERSGDRRGPGRT